MLQKSTAHAFEPRTITPIPTHLHTVGNVEVGRVEARLLVLQHALDEVGLVVGDLPDVVALCKGSVRTKFQ